MQRLNLLTEQHAYLQLEMSIEARNALLSDSHAMLRNVEVSAAQRVSRRHSGRLLTAVELGSTNVRMAGALPLPVGGMQLLARQSGAI